MLEFLRKFFAFIFDSGFYFLPPANQPGVTNNPTPTNPDGSGLPYVTVAKAAAEQQLASVPKFGVSDTASAVTAGLPALAQLNKLTALQITNGNSLAITGATYAAYTSLLDKLITGQMLTVSGASIGQAAALQADTHVGGFTVTGTSPAILSAVSQLATDTRLTGWTASDTTIVRISAVFWGTNRAFLDRIGGGESLAVSSANVAQAISLQADRAVSSFTVTDTSAHVQSALDALNADTHLAGITLSDGKPVAFTYAQYQFDTMSRAALGAAGITVGLVPAIAAATISANPYVNTEGVSDTLANIGTNLATLENLALRGKLSAIAVTDSGKTLTLTPVQYAASLDAIKLMSGNFTIVQSSATPPLVPTPTPSGGLHINFVQDTSIAAAPTAFLAALNSAATMIEAVIANNITLNIEVGWGEIAGHQLAAGVAAGSTNLDSLQSYSAVAASLKAHITGPAALNLNLPASNPFGTTRYDVAGAQAKAWGQQTAAGLDGAIGVASNGWRSSDFVGVLLHEITHVMGRNSGWGGINGDTTPLDLFRYSSPSFLATDGSVVDPTLHTGASGLQYFSVDGGRTILADFANQSDYGDWASNSLSVNDPMNAFISGTPNVLTAVDLTELGALGFSLTTAGVASATHASNAAALMTQAMSSVNNQTSFIGSGSLTPAMMAQIQASMTEVHNLVS